MRERRVLRPRARRRAAGPQRTYRLASSVRLPCALGLALLLMLALAIALLVGRTDGDPLAVPRALLDFHEAVARDGAQSVRRGVNEGVDDLEQLALVLSAARDSPDVGQRFAGLRTLGGLARAEGRSSRNGAGLTSVLRGVATAHGRYQAIYALAAERRVLAHVGGDPLPRALRPGPPYKAPGMQDAKPTSNRGAPLIQQYAPVTDRGRWPVTIVGHYDPRFMRFALEVAQPGDAWVVNRRGRVIGALGSAPRFGTLPREALRAAARRATGGASGAVVTGGSADRQEVVGYSPIAGPGPAGQFGWSVVTARTVTSLSLPQADARSHALLAGFALALIALITFGWIYVVVLRPLLILQGDAERLAYGDLSRNVQIVRYDEIGLIARSLERLRVSLIRRRVQAQSRESQHEPDP